MVFYRRSFLFADVLSLFHSLFVQFDSALLAAKVDHVADISSLNKPYISTLVRVVVSVRIDMGKLKITLDTFTWMSYQTISFVGPTSCDLLYNLPVLRVERKYLRCILKKNLKSMSKRACGSEDKLKWQDRLANLKMDTSKQKSAN